MEGRELLGADQTCMNFISEDLEDGSGEEHQSLLPR